MTTFLNQPVTLEGKQPETGGRFPDFTVTTTSLEDIQPLQNGKKTILLAVPSVDTPVCSLELARFLELLKDQENLQVVSVSMDLPFALDRWCQAKANDKILTTSDYKHRSFAKAAGIRMKENGLLARAVYVLDEDGRLVYKEVVDEVSHEPDYTSAMKAAGITK